LHDGAGRNVPTRVVQYFRTSGSKAAGAVGGVEILADGSRPSRDINRPAKHYKLTSAHDDIAVIPVQY
jgi:hypothetical protein